MNKTITILAAMIALSAGTYYMYRVKPASTQSNQTPAEQLVLECANKRCVKYFGANTNIIIKLCSDYSEVVDVGYGNYRVKSWVELTSAYNVKVIHHFSCIVTRYVDESMVSDAPKFSICITESGYISDSGLTVRY